MNDAIEETKNSIKNINVENMELNKEIALLSLSRVQEMIRNTNHETPSVFNGLAIGDKVEVKDSGQCYSTFSDFFDKFDEIKDKKGSYQDGKCLTDMNKHNVYKLIFMGEHDGGMLAVIERDFQMFLIDVKGLIKHTPYEYKVGDFVEAYDTGECFANYTSFFDEQTEVRRLKPHFGGDIATRDTENERFKIMYIGEHRRYSDMVAVLQSDNKSYYLMGLKGLTKTDVSQRPWGETEDAPCF